MLFATDGQSGTHSFRNAQQTVKPSLFPRLFKRLRKRREIMKAFFGKLLRLLKLDALLLGLLEKIALGLIKKITSLQYAAKELLDELLSPDNGVI